MSLIAVVDYGMGNLRSVAKALEHVAPEGADIQVTSSPDVIHDAERVVFPGQGAARDCMHELKALQLIEPVRQAAAEKPFLGICMGMQVLLTHSQENQGVDCMGVYGGEVRWFGNELQTSGPDAHKIPHMGWNNVYHRKEHPLWNGIEDASRFYFVHSYYVDPDDSDLVAGETEYGITFTSALACANVFAVQFHPEKSAADGLRLLQNFTRWDGRAA